MNLLVSLLIVVLVLGLIWYLLTLVPIPEPFRKMAQIIFVVIAVLLLLSFLPGAPLHITWGST